MATKTAPRSKVNLRPLGNKVIVRRDEGDEMTDAGLYLPESAKDKPKSGTIVAVGTGAINTETGERIPMTLSVGDQVLFTSYAGSEVKLDDEELLIMSEDEVLATFD